MIFSDNFALFLCVILQNSSFDRAKKSTFRMFVLKLLKVLWDSALLNVVAHTAAVGQLGAVGIRP